MLGVVAILVAAGALYFVFQAGRLDDLRRAVERFEAPQDWEELVLVEQVDRSYSPFCMDSECPSSYRRYATSARAMILDDIASALEQSGYSNIDAPAANCLQSDRCNFSAMSEGIRVRISTIDVSDVAQYSLGDVIVIPAGFTGFTVVVAAD